MKMLCQKDIRKICGVLEDQMLISVCDLDDEDELDDEDIEIGYYRTLYQALCFHYDLFLKAIKCLRCNQIIENKIKYWTNKVQYYNRRLMDLEMNI